MIDFHSHILFGVDDGSGSIEESVEMIALAEKLGFTHIVATPHYICNSEFNSSYNDNKDLLDRLKYRILMNGIDVKLSLGNELFFDTGLIHELEKDIAATMNESRYVLLEIPRSKILFDTLLSFIFELQVKGFLVVLAHPERYDFVVEDPSKIVKLIERDVYIQLNLLSLVGTYGKPIKETAKILLDHSMVHFIGSDAHKTAYYEKAGESLHILKESIGKEYFKEITETNPQWVLDNELFYPEKPVSFKKKKKFGFFKK